MAFENEVGITVKGKDNASGVLRRIGEDGSKSMEKLKGTVQKMPEQFGKAQGALLLFQNSMGQTGGKAAEVAGKVSGLIGLIATGGPLGIAIAAVTGLVAIGSEAWSIYTSEVNAAKQAAAAIEKVFKRMDSTLSDLRNETMSLADQVRFFGQDSLTAAILKQWDFIEANEKGVKSIEDEIRAFMAAHASVKAMTDEEVHHISNLVTIRDKAKAVLVERKKQLENLEELANKQAELDDRRERSSRQMKRHADQERQLAEERRRRAEEQKRQAEEYAEAWSRGVASVRNEISLEAQSHEARARLLDTLQQQEQQRLSEKAQQWANAAASVGQVWATAFQDMASGSQSASEAVGGAAISSAQTVISTAAAAAAAQQLAAHSYIPFVGIAIGSAFAAAIFGIIKSYLGKFDTGGIYRSPGGSGMAVLHDKERVLSVQQTVAFEKLVNHLTSRSQTASLSPSGQTRVINNYDMKSMIPRQGAELQRSVIEINKAQKRLAKRGM